MADLSTLLEQTTGTDEASVQVATASLQREANAPGFGLKLLAVCASAVGGGHNENCGVAAATYLKNFIKSTWMPPSGGESIISEMERIDIRTQLVDVLLRVEGAMLRVLAEAFRLVAKYDFAEKKWPDLVGGLHGAITRSNLVNGMQDSQIKTLNALIAVDAVVKPFQYFRDPTVAKETAPEELENLTRQLLVPMHNIFHLITTQILAGQVGVEQDSILLIICKVFHHTIKSYMPTALEATVGMWIADVVSLLGAVVVSVPLAEPAHEARLKAWKRMLQICSVLTTRHRKHADKFLTQMFEAPMRIVTEASKVTGLPYLQERVVALSFSLIGSILETGAGWRIVASHFSQLLENAVLPALCLHKEDVEEWEADEEEYLSKNLPSDLDNASGWREDLYTPRRNALNLLGIIATAKGPPTAGGAKKGGPVTAKRKKGCKVKMPNGTANPEQNPMAGDVLVLPYLQNFALPRDGSNTDSDDVIKYYGVLLAYGGLQEYFSKKDEQVGPLLESRVFPLYSMISPSPFVLANANWLLGELCNSIPAELVTTCFRALLKSIGSKDIGELSWRPVRSAAAGAIAKFVTLEAEDVSIPWLELLQAAVAGVASDCEDEAATMLQLLATITETNNKGLAAHMPAVFGSVAESVCRHIPPPPEDWPWVVECGFRTLYALLGTWNTWVDEEEGDQKVVPDSDVGRISIASSIATLLQNAWLAPQEDAEQMEPTDSVEATPSCLGEASFFMIELCYRAEDMAAVERWKVEDLLQSWAHRISDWPAWQEDEEENVFNAIEAAIDLHKRCALPHFAVAKEAPQPGLQMEQQSVMEGMTEFLRFAIEAADASTVWKACHLVHSLLHSCALTFESQMVNAVITRLAQAMLIRLASEVEDESFLKPITLAMATCFLSSPTATFCRPPRDEPPLPEGLVMWGNALVKVVGNKDSSELDLESEAKVSLLALVRLVELLDKTSAGAPQGVELARSAVVAIMEGLLQLKKIQAQQDEMEEVDEEEAVEEDEDVEESGDDDSDEDSEADHHEETHEEFLQRYARAAKQAEEEVEEQEESEPELEEIELGTFALTDEVMAGMGSVKSYAQRLFAGHPVPQETVLRFVEEFPLAKQMLS